MPSPQPALDHQFERLFPNEESWPYGERPVIITRPEELGDVDGPESIDQLRQGALLIVGGSATAYVASAHRHEDVPTITDELARIPDNWSEKFEKQPEAQNPWTVLHAHAVWETL